MTGRLEKLMTSNPELGETGPTNIVSIQGGLGNQLFEWGFAHALAAKGSRVIVDTVRCRGDRPLEIGALLKGHERLAKPWGYAALLAEKTGLLQNPKLQTTHWRLVKEQGFSHDPEIMDSLLHQNGGRNYILGYFQSPKYFAGQESIVRSAVTGLLHGMLTKKGQAKLDQLTSTANSVAVHVRRGDYVSSPTTAVHHGNLGGRYYEPALSAMRDLGKHNVIWFSDDTEWVRAELARPEDTVATPALMAELTTAAGGEIALMAACSSRVVANSSFSWWAGWLGGPSTAHSPVVAPSSWLAGLGEPAQDLVPAEWLRF